MTQEELDALPDVTPQIHSEERIIGGKRVHVPVQQNGVGALFTGSDDGQFTCDKTGTRYMVGWHNGVRVKRRSNTWT